MNDERVRQRVEFLVAGWPEQVVDSSRLAPGHVIQYEDGRWEFHLVGQDTVRGDSANGESEIVLTILRAFGRYL